jgi:hypothetical protein
MYVFDPPLPLKRKAGRHVKTDISPEQLALNARKNAERKKRLERKTQEEQAMKDRCHRPF